MFSWIAILAGCLLISFVAMALFRTRNTMLNLRNKHKIEFSLLANELVSIGKLDAKHRDKIERLSQLLSTFSGQMAAMKALAQIQKEQREAGRVGSTHTLPVSDTNNLDADLQDQWRSMFLHWLIAVCAQRSILGIVSVWYLMDVLGRTDVAGRAEAKLDTTVLLEAT